MSGSSRGAQPGGRAPAPGRLAILQAFLNTHFDLGRDFGAEILHSPEALAAWLHAAGLLEAGAPVEPGDLERALQLRASLRALAGNPGVDATRRARVIASMPWPPAFRSGCASAPADLPSALRPAPALRGALGALLAISAQAMLDGRWSRLKVCPGPHCGWLFYDQSRNRSGRWCSMSVCGGREKARSHYQRHRRA